jgi:hypothetical protein
MFGWHEQRAIDGEHRIAHARCVHDARRAQSLHEVTIRVTAALPS